MIRLFLRDSFTWFDPPHMIHLFQPDSLTWLICFQMICLFLHVIHLHIIHFNMWFPSHDSFIYTIHFFHVIHLHNSLTFIWFIYLHVIPPHTHTIHLFSQANISEHGASVSICDDLTWIVLSISDNTLFSCMKYLCWWPNPSCSISDIIQDTDQLH